MKYHVTVQQIKWIHIETPLLHIKSSDEKGIYYDVLCKQ